MRFEEQGTLNNSRYTVVPRTLVFLIQDERVLLLRGAPDKRLWANKLNGIGGHVEAGESILEAARREFHEETGLTDASLTLQALVHVAGSAQAPGVMLYVYLATQARGQLAASSEGALEWHALHALPTDQLVADIAPLLGEILANPTHMVYGHYVTDRDGNMSFSFE